MHECALNCLSESQANVYVIILLLVRFLVNQFLIKLPRSGLNSLPAPPRNLSIQPFLDFAQSFRAFPRALVCQIQTFQKSHSLFGDFRQKRLCKFQLSPFSQDPRRQQGCSRGGKVVAAAAKGETTGGKGPKKARRKRRAFQQPISSQYSRYH